MFVVEKALLVAGILTLVAVWSSKLSARFGVPVLVLCLGIGMLAGSEGLGRIPFDDYLLAHAVGTLALVVILFDGGLRTSFRTVSLTWRPASILATLGVLLTAFLVGLAAMKILDLPLLHGLLVGSIVSSTDAAAVFLILKKQGLRLRERLSAILELESGSNDPMAIFLVLGLLGAIQGQVESVGDFLWLLLVQMGGGALSGLLIGRLGAWLLNRIELDTPGLYPILAGSLALLSFGLATAFQGSGFLAVYLCGILLGSREVVYRRGIYMFFDGVAWLGQIAMFVVLGLLVFPSSLIGVAWEGIVLALFLTLIGRPIAVALCLSLSGYSLKELVLISWAGLKGAVPIILAIYPLLFQVEHARPIFNVVFFVVLFSALTQGWSLPWVARKLGLDEGQSREPYATLEITSLRHLDAEIVEYLLCSSSPAAGHRLGDLPLPKSILVALVARDKLALPPDGDTVLQPGDYLFVVQHSDLRSLMDRIFGGVSSLDALFPSSVQFQMSAEVSVAQLKKYYDIDLPQDEEITLGEILVSGLGTSLELENFLLVGNWTLGLRAMEDGVPTGVFLSWIGP